jgi:hypothetical protein
MNKYFPDNPRQIISILLMSVTGILALFFWQSHQGLSLSDEGFLWYGAQRVMVGEVPMRDFMAYDIGRYYWLATIMSLIGDNGIVALRAATTIFQVIALYVGLVMLIRSSAKQLRLFWLLAMITLVAWMAPQYRLFDISLPIMLVGTLSFLAEQPTKQRYFLTGLIVGLVAVFGRNHGIYAVAGSLSVMLYLTVKRDGEPSLITAFATWALGVIVGYLPVLVFLAVVPGFAQAFWESIRLLFDVKATNFPLPVPWPWLVQFRQTSTVGMLHGIAMGIFFIAIAVFGLLGIAWAIRQRLQDKPVSPALIAAISLALPYAHYAYSRADLEHLAPSIPPFLMGILALLANQPAKIKWPFAVLLCGLSLLVMLPLHPRWYCYSTQKCVDINVAGDMLKVDLETTKNLAMFSNAAERFAPGDRTFIAAPFWPGAYAALGRKSPMWEIYALFPRNAAFQQAEIERIKAANPGFVVINDFALDGHDDLRFRHTHPIIDQYIRDNFVPLNGPNLVLFRYYRSKQVGQ